MINDEILDSLSPCGLSCRKCFAHEHGDIRRHSQKLKEKLGNFDAYAERFVTLLDNPIFEIYGDFKAMLDFFASENCKGCRKENCRVFKNCGVRGCHQEKKIDFCFQCDEFPCEKTNFDENLQMRWIQLNEKIREKGIEKFYDETKDTPRY